MRTNHKIKEIRALAVEQHNVLAEDFEAKYRQMEGSDHFASAFLYGRNKIDGLLYPWVEAQPHSCHILDVGCGTGEQLRRIRERGIKVSGVEPAPRMRSLAMRNNPNTEIVDGSITEIPFPDGTFDALIAIEVLRYLHREDVLKAYVEMLRVLKPGGQIFVTLVNLWAADGFFVFDKLKGLVFSVSGQVQPPHCEFVTPDGVEWALKAAGAGEVQTYGRLFGPIRMGYKIDPRLGRFVAGSLSSFDDALSQMRWMIPFAGHLVVIAFKPK